MSTVWKEVGVSARGEEKWTALGLFATYCWHIWLARNELIFKRERVAETRIHAKAMDDFSTYALELSNTKAGKETRTERVNTN